MKRGDERSTKAPFHLPKQSFVSQSFEISKLGTHSLDKLKSHIVACSFILKNAVIPKCDEIGKIKVKYKFI